MCIQSISTRTIQARIVGTSFNGRQAVVAQLQEREQVFLVRDPNNVFDRNAIKVVRKNGQQVGFLDRYLAARLSARLDNYGQPLQAYISSITGGFYPGSCLGVLIRFELPE
jgi:single-stranded-DNA-specific exonuclease